MFSRSNIKIVPFTFFVEPQPEICACVNAFFRYGTGEGSFATAGPGHLRKTVGSLEQDSVHPTAHWESRVRA